MIFNFSSKNEVQINMNLYTSKIIKEFPEEIIGKTSTPAGDHLFKIREDGRKLDGEMQMACWPSSRQYATFLGVCCYEVKHCHCLVPASSFSSLEFGRLGGGKNTAVFHPTIPPTGQPTK
jgi:hypothetical protein